MPVRWHSRLSEKLYLQFSSLPPFISLHFEPLFFSFFSFSYAWPCPIHLQTFPLPSPQSRPHLLADNNTNLTLPGLIPAQTPPTLTIPPALLIPLLAPVPIAVRQQVHRTSFLSLFLPPVDFLHLISSTAVNTSRLALRLRQPDVPILQTRLHQIKRNRIAQKARRVPYMPISLIVLILLVLAQVRLPRLDDLSFFSLYYLHSVPPRWAVRCLCSISQQASHQGPHVCMDLYQR